MSRKIIVLILLLSLIGVYFGFLRPTEQDPTNGDSNFEFLSNSNLANTDNFLKAEKPREFVFPQDYGAHPEFLTEWWYYTGNVFTTEGRHFGYQLTFFRRALPGVINEGEGSIWESNQIYLAHFAITDTENNNHFVADKISRGVNGLAGTNTNPMFSIWLNDWKINQVEKDVFQMQAKDDEFEIDFILENLKNEIFHGENGLSQKGDAPGNASYYFSQTRLLTTGQLKIGDQWFEINGFSWMDHEFGTSTLGKNQIGWDWFSIQLDNDTELMLFQIRNSDGSISPFSSGTFIDQQGNSSTLVSNTFNIDVTKTWRNSNQIEYPAQWTIKIEELDMNLEITPVINDQEMDLYFQYWEGAVVIRGTVNGEIVSGYGYVELTGYAQSMQGIF